MERFLTPKLEKEVSELTLDYIFAEERISLNNPNFIEKNRTAKGKMEHIYILAGWMGDGNVQYDDEAWEHLKNNYLVSAYIRMAELNDMVVHASNNSNSPFNLVYCPEKMQEYQKYRARLWWEYFNKKNKFFHIGQANQNQFSWYKGEEISNFLEQQQILDDEYIRTLAKKFHPEEYK